MRTPAKILLAGTLVVILPCGAATSQDAPDWLLNDQTQVTSVISDLELNVVEATDATTGTSAAVGNQTDSRSEAAFLDAIVSAPWAARAQLHDSAAGQRARLDRLVPPFAAGHELYTCGSAAYMDAVFEAAQARGWPPEALHREFFSAPEAPGRVDHAFQLLLVRSGRVLEVPAHRSATDVLADQGLAVPVKCADGLCGVCAVLYDATRSGEIDHRDVVLSAAQRRDRIVLCCSRGVQGTVVAVDL